MTALAQATTRRFQVRADNANLELIVKTANTIYKGAIVCSGADGLAVPGADAASTKFEGFAEHDAAAGEKVMLIQEGVVVMAVTGVSGASSRGATVVITDDNTLALDNTNDIPIGKVENWDAAVSLAHVFFQGHSRRSI